MKITNLSTLILSPKAEEAIQLFEELGFYKKHTKNNISEGTVTGNVLVDDDGHMITIVDAPVPSTITSIRMNVDNFTEAYDLLKSKGFTNITGQDHVEDTGSSKAAMLFSPTGFAISLAQHIK